MRSLSDLEIDFVAGGNPAESAGTAAGAAAAAVMVLGRIEQHQQQEIERDRAYRAAAEACNCRPGHTGVR